MADDKELIDQDEIEKLLQHAGGVQPPPQKQSSLPPNTGVSTSDALDQSDIEALLGGIGGGVTDAKPERANAPSAGDADRPLAQDDIESLLNQTKKTPPATKSSALTQKPVPTPRASAEEILPEDMEFLLRQAEEALASIESDPTAETPPGVAAFRLEEFSGAPASSDSATLDLIRDVELDLKIELGRTHMYLEDVLKLRRGSVVPLDKLAGDPVDIYVNGRLIARGEVLVLNDNFCVRVAELIAGAGAA